MYYKDAAPRAGPGSVYSNYGGGYGQAGDPAPAAPPVVAGESYKFNDWLSNPWIIGGVIAVILILIFVFYIMPSKSGSSASARKFAYY